MYNCTLNLSQTLFKKKETTKKERKINLRGKPHKILFNR